MLVKSKWAMVTVTSVFLAAQAAVMLMLAAKGRYDYIRSVAVDTGFWVAYVLLEVRNGFTMSTYVRVLVTLALFFDSFFGYYFDLYAISFVFDKMLHFFGTYSFALFAYILLAQALTEPVSKPVKFILAVSLGLSLGALYEIMEFFTDLLNHPVPSSQPSLLDTDLDLLANALGSLLAGAHVIARDFVDREI